ncbi:MAG: metal-dependent transcriptional regulator [Micrococcales bacterium]|nr:metal-dependent transcriptional regulator [Micrococcales bacterium]MCL2666190.1 metal-dependent transcriptional regulator [Micrococcales bacterium]
MSDLIDTTEMYLKTVYELTEEGVPPLRARIAERLGHSGPTVSQTVARMERDGLVVLRDDRHLELTDDGRARAVRVMRKHRLAERLLTDIIGLDWPLVHQEACRWEHVVSEQVEHRLAALLRHPRHDPYGNPIPGLEELGGPGPAQFLEGVTPLSAWTAPQGVLARIGESVQVDTELLARLAGAGIAPGTTIDVRGVPASEDVEAGQGVVTVSVPGSDVLVDLPQECARHLFVSPA